MRRVRVGDSPGKVRLLRPVATLSGHGTVDAERSPAPSGWRAHRAEIIFVVVVWILALVQVGIVVARGGVWTPDSTLALAFALICPLVLRGFGRIKDASP
jgi:hypothetical protein